MKSAKKNVTFFLIPFVVCLITMSIFLIYAQLHWITNTEEKKGGYCEIHHQGLFLEPINTWSNLGFIIIGLIIACQLMYGTFKMNINRIIQSDFMSIFFPSLVVFLGPCSMMLHATYTRLGYELDVLSEYLLCAFLVAYSTQRLFRMNVKYFIGVFLLIIAICESVSRWNIYLPIIGGIPNILVAVFILLFIISEIFIVFIRRSKIRKLWILACGLTFIGAFLIWYFTDTGRPLCSPTSWFQGHALWHVLVAIALYFLFRYFISENNNDQMNSIANIF